MSMLAERRKKQKWSLNPRGKAWSEDSNKFGQKLLEKMGWSAGKGLGAKEDGITEHIKVSYKHDSRGMGFKETDNQWTEHETNFSQLLSSLSGENANIATDKENKIKLESLEKKSQKSRARVHYHKFTRGKDISRYSEKDLANIFGRKTLNETKKTVTEEKTQNNNWEISETKNYGVETHNGGSMLDYFKKKLPNYKKYSVQNDVKPKNENSDSDNERTSFGFGFNMKGSENEVKSSFVSYVMEDMNGEVESEIKTDTVVKKKKKSKKNGKLELVEDEIHENGAIGMIEPAIHGDSPSSVKRKLKRKSEGEVECAFTPLKKKFKNFNNLNELDDAEKIVQTPVKKTKKKKSKSKFEDEYVDKTPNKRLEKEDNGFTNPAFEPMGTKVSVEKHALDVINEEDEVQEDLVVEPVELVRQEEIFLENHKEVKTKKKRKVKSIEGVQNLCFEELKDDSITDENTQIDESSSNMTPDEPRKKAKKSKKKQIVTDCGVENSAFDDNFNNSELIEENGEKFEVKKKNKKRKLEEEGIANPGFEDILNSDSTDGKKKSRDERKKSKKSDKNLSETEQAHQGNDSKTKKRSRDQLVPVENPCFNPDDSMECSENSSPLYEVKRKKKKATSGIENPGLDVTTPSPKKKSKKIEKTPIDLEMPIMDEQVMLNVVSTPVNVKKNEEKSQRRKSVRFSAVNQKIFINGMDSPADLRKNGMGGIDNGACDTMEMHIEENIDTLSRQLDNYQAEVENDLNEAKMEIMVGEMGDPNGENEILSSGDAKLKFKYSNFGKIPPWLRKNNEGNARTSYRHLIKGDIVLGFKNTNLHEIKGYGIKKQNVSS